MAEIWFDTRDGKLLTGEEELVQHQSSESDLVLLTELLRAKDFPYNLGDYERIDSDHASKEDIFYLGKRALQLVQQGDETISLTTPAIRRLDVLGLMVTIKSIYREFGSVSEFQSEIGTPTRTNAAQFTEWDYPRFVQYAREISAGKPISMALIRQKYQAGEGPSLHLVKQIGGVRRLNEELGFPDTSHWEDDNYINHGVRVAEANPGIEFGRVLYDCLATKVRGPWSKVSIQRFGSWTKYKTLVMEELEYRRDQRKLRISRIREDIASNKLPEDLADFDDNLLIRAVGLFRVVGDCAPEIPIESRVRMTGLNNGQLLSELQRHNAELTPGRIELSAVELGVFDDIWTPDDHARSLIVPTRELKKRRKMHSRNGINSRRRKSQSAAIQFKEDEAA